MTSAIETPLQASKMFESPKPWSPKAQSYSGNSIRSGQNSESKLYKLFAWFWILIRSNFLLQTKDHKLPWCISCTKHVLLCRQCGQAYTHDLRMPGTSTRLCRMTSDCTRQAQNTDSKSSPNRRNGLPADQRLQIWQFGSDSVLQVLDLLR